MQRSRMPLSTGLTGLDHVLRGLRPGDNVVWQVDSVEDYQPFVEPYCEHAKLSKQKVVYFRFADHEPLVAESEWVQVHHLDPELGFEPFLGQIHQVISRERRGCLYLFDCLSQLAPDWRSDRMVGNFFMLTCPYLYDRTAIAYFAILRSQHSFHALGPISRTTQIFVDVYRHRGTIYVCPAKVQHRHSPTMYTLHAWEGDTFRPVTQSCVLTEILGKTSWAQTGPDSYLRGFWSRTFAEAEILQLDVEAGRADPELVDDYFHRLLRMLVSRDPTVLEMAVRYFTLEDLLRIRRRMIGTGLIGGKAVGMLLARAILCKSDPRWNGILEEHDSFHVGADVYYTFLVQNGCWWMVHRQNEGESSDYEIETARHRILAGEFPDYIVAQFADLLDYFGQCPIIVRSSSLLEDSFNSAFAGQYESIFCANQGGHHKRLEDFLCAVRTVYASALDPDALAYRKRRGLLHHDEQMGLLIQRVSGARQGPLFFPQAAGVGFSFNPYAWHESIDPEAGVVRLVFGVGTRAVDRSDDDYTRVVALNAPMRRPEANFDEVKQYAQRRVDVIDLEGNQLTSAMFDDICALDPKLPMDMFASRDHALERQLKQSTGKSRVCRVLTFEKLLRETDYVANMRDMLSTLSEAYGNPVDTEFALNFFDSADGASDFRINLVQCRPLVVAGNGDTAGARPLPEIAEADVVLSAKGAVVGQSAILDIDWIIYVVPNVYSALLTADRHAVARAIGEICHHADLQGQKIMLVGPGRWGTTTPSLGVPVCFLDIKNVVAMAELVVMHDSLVPDVSLGTHFFNELVENNMLYMAVFPGKPGNCLNEQFLAEQVPDQRAHVLPNAGEWGPALRVLRPVDIADAPRLHLHVNTRHQEAICYLAHGDE